MRSYDESSSSSDDEYVKDSLSGRIVDPHAMFAAMFGAGPARAAIGDDGYEREMNRSDREVMFAYDVDGCDDVDAWGRYVRRTAGLVYAPERGGRFVLERRGEKTWVLAEADGGAVAYEAANVRPSESAPLHGWAPAREGLGSAPPRVKYVRDCEAKTRPGATYVKLRLDSGAKLGLRLDATLRLSEVPPGSEVALAGAQRGWTCVFADKHRVRAPNDVNVAVKRARDRKAPFVVLGFHAAAPPRATADAGGALAKPTPQSRQIGGSFREFSRFTQPLQREADRARDAAKDAPTEPPPGEEASPPSKEEASPPKEAPAFPAWTRAAAAARRLALTSSALALNSTPCPTAGDPDAESAYGVVVKKNGAIVRSKIGMDSKQVGAPLAKDAVVVVAEVATNSKNVLRARLVAPLRGWCTAKCVMLLVPPDEPLADEPPPPPRDEPGPEPEPEPEPEPVAAAPDVPPVPAPAPAPRADVEAAPEPESDDATSSERQPPPSPMPDASCFAFWRKQDAPETTCRWPVVLGILGVLGIGAIAGARSRRA